MFSPHYTVILYNKQINLNKKLRIKFGHTSILNDSYMLNKIQLQDVDQIHLYVHCLTIEQKYEKDQSVILKSPEDFECMAAMQERILADCLVFLNDD